MHAQTGEKRRWEGDMPAPSKKRMYDVKMRPLATHDTEWLASQARVTLNATLDRTELDTGASRCCNLIVLDDFFGERERSELMHVLAGPEHESHNKPHPPPSKWERTTSDGKDLPVTYGPKLEVLEQLESGEVEAVREIWSRLCKLYPEYDVCLQPANKHFVTNSNQTPQHVCLPVVGNAPVPGDQFTYHYDGDPASFPPSNWTRSFGSYVNHEPGKPLFVSLIIYLCKFWRRDMLAETLFLDDETSTGIFIRPRPYRAVLMDQDVLHRISAPSNLAKMPRYSAVWKLVIVPKPGVTASLALPEWGKPLAFGSTAAKAEQHTNGSIRHSNENNDNNNTTTIHTSNTAATTTKTTPTTSSSSSSKATASHHNGGARPTNQNRPTIQTPTSTSTSMGEPLPRPVSARSPAAVAVPGKTQQQTNKTSRGNKTHSHSHSHSHSQALPASSPSSASEHSGGAASSFGDYKFDMSGIRGVPNRLRTFVPPVVHAFTAKSQTFTVDEKYHPLNEIGSGAYGVVCAAIDTKTDVKVAIKKVPKVFDDLIDAKRILREIKLLRHLHHENVVSLYDLIPPPSIENFFDMYIVLNLMETDLHKIIHSKNTLSDDHIQYFVYQILRGLKYIHSANVMHRDLKPSNILLNGNCDLKICDFGLARGIGDAEDGNLTEYVVTRWYRAPEVMCSCREYDNKIDVWSVGCIMAELHGRKPLFPGKDYIQQMNLIFDILGSPTPSDTSFISNKKALQYIQTQMEMRKPIPLASIYPQANPTAVSLMESMLTFNPHKRISVQAALDHPYFRNLRAEDTEVTCNASFEFEFEKAELTEENIKNEMFDEITLFRPYLRR